jgi:hypothetical protein
MSHYKALIRYNILIVSGPFVRTDDLRVTDNPNRFSCDPSVIGFEPWFFYRSIETEVGNGDPLYLDHPILDERGYFVGVTYLQSSGWEVSVFLG